MNSKSNMTNVYDSNQKTNHMYIDGGNSSSHSSPPPPGLDVAVEAILDCLISKSEDLSVPGSTHQAVPSSESDDIPTFGETNFPVPTAILASNDNDSINNATTPPASTSGIIQPEVEVPSEVGTLQLQPPSTSTTQWHVYVHDIAGHVAIDMDQLQFIVHFESEAEHELEVDEDEDEDEDEDSEDFESDDDHLGGYQTEFKQVHNGRPVLKLKV